MKRLLAAAAIVTLLAGAAFLQSRYDEQAAYFKPRQVLVNLPKPKVLKALSLGFHDTVAELIFLWSIQFYSTTYYSNRWDNIEQVFDTIIELSPDNPDFYQTGSFMMAREAGKVPEALKLLERGAEHFQNDYIYEFWAAVFAATALKDYGLAAHYSQKAAKRPNALPGIMNLYAHYVFQQDDLDNAWDLFSELKRTSPHESIRRSADMHLYDIQYERDQKVFGEIAERFRERRGRWPRDFEELIKTERLRDAPLDYKGEPYRYNPETGRLVPNQKSGWKQYS